MSTPDLRTAASLLERGDFDGARVTLERLVKHDQAYAAAHVLLAKIAESQSRFTDAILHWERAYLINPMSTEISVSYKGAVLRTLLPNPAAAPVREMNLVPPLEEIESGDREVEPEKSRWTSRKRKTLDDSAVVVTDTETTDAAEPTEAPIQGQKPLRVERTEDLDRLIDELDSARLVPDPNVETISDDELINDIEDVVSETLARIYVSQNYFSEAGDVYEKLAIQNPARKDEFAEKAADMFSRALARN